MAMKSTIDIMYGVWTLDIRCLIIYALSHLLDITLDILHFNWPDGKWLYMQNYIVQWSTFSVVWMLSTVILHQKVARLLDNQKFIVLKLFTWILQGFLCSKKLWSDNTFCNCFFLGSSWSSCIHGSWHWAEIGES